MKSNYQQAQEHSSYHFDPRRIDTRSDVIRDAGYFAPTADWDHMVQHIIDHSAPATWATRGYKGQGREIPPKDLEIEQLDLSRHGYSVDHVIADIAWEIPKIFQGIADSFDLADTMVRMHVQQPGQTWNLHIDKLHKWCPDHPDRVRRIFVQLTDWQPGQFWEFGNYHWHGWRRGEAIEFDWQNMPHCTANAGYHARVTMQITGVDLTK